VLSALGEFQLVSYNCRASPLGKRLAFMVKEIVLIASICVLPLAAQTVHQKAATQPHSGNGQSQLDQLDAKITALEKRIANLETSIEIYKYLLDEKQEKNDTAVLDPSSRDFLRLDSNIGSFLVSLDDASPYLDGYRVKLSIGNPSNAKFQNAKLKVRWGRSLKSTGNYSKWQASLHEKEVDLTNDLEAGYWNQMTVDLIPCNPDELGYLEVSLQTPSIILHVHPAQ
jgi:hypothetical protein